MKMQPEIIRVNIGWNIEVTDPAYRGTNQIDVVSSCFEPYIDLFGDRDGYKDVFIKEITCDAIDKEFVAAISFKGMKLEEATYGWRQNGVNYDKFTTVAVFPEDNPDIKAQYRIDFSKMPDYVKSIVFNLAITFPQDRIWYKVNHISLSILDDKTGDPLCRYVIPREATKNVDEMFGDINWAEGYLEFTAE